ncbi:MAG: FAD-dependent oxidoreductase [Thermoplasmatota archaeon]
MKLVIVGCGAAGATAAQFARKQDRKADIVVLEKGSYPQYSKCALPWVVSGELAPEDTIEFSREWFDRADIDLRLDTEVTDVDFESKAMHTADGKEAYDVLILATGAQPFSPVEMAGNTFFLRTLDDAVAVKKQAIPGSSAVVIGAGLIGLEAAEALREQDVEVTIVEFLPNLLLNMLDDDMAAGVRQGVPDDIVFRFDTRVTSLTAGDPMQVTVERDGDEDTIKADFVLVATGNRPNVGLAEQLADDRAIQVDERCRTNIPDVYAVGDCTRYQDVMGSDVVVGLGSTAVRQAVVAGRNAVGGDATMPPLLNARTTRLFDMEIAAVGPTSEGMPFSPLTGKFPGSTLPDYMDGDRLLVKVLADSHGRLVGAQAIGPGATQHVNRFAVAIQHGLTLEQFADVETAYAPLVAPVFDASTVACNIARRRIR